MKNKKKVFLRKRDFLNLPDSTWSSYVICNIVGTEYKGDENKIIREVDNANFRLSNCERTIDFHLSFDTSEKGNYPFNNCINKISKLKRYCEDIEKAFHI